MRLVVTEPAKWHLQDIHDYYKYKVSVRIANKIKTGILEKLRYLQQHPLSGQEEENLRELGLEHRRMVQGNYKIVYRIEKNTIYVTDIFDSRQDPAKITG